ncbi:hypothetical protein BMS3Abin06_00957 [bacterium BMS3Abin06]|nr:hypothetical protein BMS3Abin06_00957 [bacterium BMS3Abin06]
MIDPPRHYHINSKASLNPLCTAQLPLFYLASALEGSVIDFNTPTKTIPLKLLYSLLESPYFTGGQQYPPQPLHSFMNIYLLSNYCKYAQFTQFFLTLRWFQLNFCKSYLQFSFSGRLFLLAWYMHYLYACRFLGRNIFIQLPLTIGKQTIMFRPDQKFWPFRFTQSKIEKLINICFTISYANQCCLSTVPLCFFSCLETLKPLIALLLLYRVLLPKMVLAKLTRITSPALYIYYSQRSSINIKSHGVMYDKTNNSFLFIANQSKILRSRMGAVIKYCCILHRQYYFLFPYSTHRCFIMRFMYLFHCVFRILQKTIRCLCFCPASARLWNIRFRTGIKISRYCYKSIDATIVSRFRSVKLLLCPVVSNLFPAHL